MLQQRVIRKAVNLDVGGLFGHRLLAVDVAPSFAGNCGGHCQVMKRCAELLKEKGAKGSAYQTGIGHAPSSLQPRRKNSPQINAGENKTACIYRQIAAALNGRGIATARGANGKRRRWRTC